jgi:hypothetical protein
MMDAEILENAETLTVLVSFVVGGLLQLIFRNWIASIAIPMVASCYVLGYLESQRPYLGGGASFYILIQIFATIFAAGAAAAGAGLIDSLRNSMTRKGR